MAMLRRFEPLPEQSATATSAGVRVRIWNGRGGVPFYFSRMRGSLHASSRSATKFPIDQQRRGHDDAVHDQIGILGEKRLHRQPAEAGPGHDVFHDERAAQQRGERVAKNGQQRIDGVAERVLVNHPAFAEAAGAGGGDVFGAQRVEQAGAHPAHDAGEVGRGEHDGRQNEMMRAVPELLRRRHEIVERALRAADGKPAGGRRKPQRQQRQQHIGHGQADKREQRAAAVHPRIFSDRRPDAQRNGDAPGDDQRGKRKQKRVPQPLEDERRGGNFVGHGIAEVAAQNIFEPEEVLDIPRPVEMELRLEAGDGFRRDLRVLRERGEVIARRRAP